MINSMYNSNSTRFRFLLILLLVTSFIPMIQLSASDLNILFRQANSFFQQGKYYDAIELYKELEKQSNDPNLYYNFGVCYEQINEPGLAVLYYKRALLIDSSHTEARSALEQIESSIISANIAESSFTNRLLFAMYNWLNINRLAVIIFLLILTLGALIYLYLSDKFALSIFAKRFFLTLTIFILSIFILISLVKFSRFANNKEVIIVQKNTLISKYENGRILSTDKKLQAGLSLKYQSPLDNIKSGYSLLILPNGELIALKNESFKKVAPNN
ncbi:hypothetical protein JEZ13_05915 [bacterium]|nr:hypothetical protein [bacterium]